MVCLDQNRPAEDGVDFVEVDISHRASVDSAVSRAVDILGGIDVLIHSAGIIRTSKFSDLKQQEFNEILDVNLLGAFHVAQESARYMMNSGGRIVLVTSIHGQIGVPGRSAYAASKGAVASLARVMASELAEHRIRVNVLAPGAVDGGMLPDPRARQGWVEATPSNRVAYLAEVAGVAAMLSSENASFVNGQIVAVDGGASTVKPII